MRAFIVTDFLAAGDLTPVLGACICIAVVCFAVSFYDWLTGQDDLWWPLVFFTLAFSCVLVLASLSNAPR